MVKRLLLACLLAFAPALAAVETTTVTGSIVDPGGAATTGGTVRWSLSIAGTALDGATPVTVSGDTLCTLTGAGAFSGCALVPNDAITPTGTYYQARFSVTTAQGVRSWTRMYSVATTPDPVALGSVTALSVPPGVTVGPFVQVQDAEPSGACTLLEMPKFARNTDRWCDCNSSVWACVAGGGGGLSGLTATRIPHATSATTIGDDPGGPFWDATNDRLGIGGAPSDDFHIQDAAGAATMVAESNAALSPGQFIGDGTAVGSDAVVAKFQGKQSGTAIANIDMARDGADDAGSIRFGTKATGVAMAERMRLDNFGLNIGTSGQTSAARKLVVRTDQNNTTEVLAWNATDGTGSQAILGAQSTTGAVSLVMRAPTWSNAVYRNLGMLRADSLADGLILATGKATAPIKFHTADVERGGVTAEGWFEWGAAGSATTNRQMVGRFDQSAASEFALWNNSSGSGAQSIVRAKGDVGSVSLIQRSSTFASPYTNVGALFADSASDGLAIVTTKAGAPVLFRTQDVERMRLTDTGLGIGKTATVPLDVQGNALVSGTLSHAGGDVGAATATTPAIGDADTSVATTAFLYQTTAAASNPALGAAQCAFSTAACSGAGGMVCESTTANNGEIEICFLGGGLSDVTINLTGVTAATRNVAMLESAQTWTAAQTNTATATSRFKILDNVYDCGSDWDGDANITNDAGDIKACLDAAKTYASTSEDGTGNAVTINLPDGDFDLSAIGGMCPYTLVGGMNIVGVRPRQQFVAGAGAADRGYPPDYDVRSNGGTWLSCGTSYTNTMFDGNKLRGVSIRDLGAKGFGTFYSSGAEQIEGTSYSHFSNLQLIGIVGSSPASAITAFNLINPHHVYAEHVNAYRVDTGWAITSWNCDWQPGNSLIVDSTLVNRARNTTDPLIYLRARSSSAPPTCAEANPNSLNYITFVRPQVMGTWNGFANSSIIKLEGASASVGIYGTAFHDVDIEGDADKDFWAASSVKNNFIGIAGCANDPRFYFETDASYNTIVNGCDRMSGYFASSTNFVYGTLDSLDVAGQRPQGNWHDRATDKNQTNTDELTVSPAWSGVTGASVKKYAAQLQTTYSSADTTNYPEFYGSWVDGALNLSTTNARAAWSAYYANPRLGGSATGNTVSTLAGFWSLPQMGSSGTGTSITDVMSYRANLYLNLGSNWAANTVCYFCADNTLATALPSGASIQNFYGLRIPDMAALGAVNEAVSVAAQTGGSTTKGNIAHGGGGYNDGHVTLGDDHVWIDKTNDRLRYKPDAAPGSETDGRAVVTSAASSTSGPAAWASNGVTCATACTNIGVASCSDSIPLDGTNTALGNCTGSTGHRLCECY